MQLIKNNELFTEVAIEESVIASGGTLADFAAFSFLSTRAASFGGAAYTIPEFVIGVGLL